MVKKNKAQVHAEASSTQTVLQLLLETSKTIASEVELEKVVQKITDVATELIGAAFGAFFYNVKNEEGEQYMLYTISGVPKEEFSKFPMPRNTKIFGPTFAGTGTVRYDDVTQVPQFGKNSPYHGMPKGHLAVKSYLAVSVISLSTKEVIGGLFFGHPDPGVFTEEAEKIVEGIAAQGAIAIENARLFEQKEKTKKKLEIALNAASIGTWTFDIQKNIIMGDPNFAKFFGANPEMMAKGIPPDFFSAAMHPDDIDKVGELVKVAIETRNCFEAEYRILCPNHKYKWVLSRGQSEYDTHHHPLYLLGSLLDITELKETEEALKRSEEKFRSMADAVPMMIWVTREDGYCTYLNKQWYTYTGQTEASGLGMGWLNVIHPDDAENSTQIFLEANEKQQPFSLEYRLKGKDGQYCWMIDTGFPKFDEEGNFEGFVGAVVDIHERKLAEEALAEQKQQYESIFNATSDAILIFDFEGYLVEVNPAALKMYGYTYEELIGRQVKTLIHPDNHQSLSDFKEAIKAEKQYFITGKHIKKDGSTLDIEVMGSSFIYKGKSHLLAVVRDVSEHKKNELALQHKEETLRLAVEATDLGTWDFNPQNGVLLWSDRCKALFGLAPEAEINYDTFLQGLHPEDRNWVDETVKSVLLAKTNGEYDIEYRTLGLEDGIERWVRANGKAYFNTHGQAVRFIGTVQDITLQKINQQVLEEKSKALEFANEDLKNFTYTISHDIKNPLSSLLFSASVAEDFTTVEEFKEIMPLIEKNSKKINDILTGLVEIIKEEETQGNVEWLNITEVIEEVKNELAETIAHNNCEIITTVRHQEIRFVRSYLQSILRNLIDNAIKYKSPLRSPRILILVQGNKHKVEFTVSDNGMGIDLEKNKKHLFQPFKRFCEEKQGTGIGLFMIKRMVEKYGGEIDLESKPGEGTTFRFTLISVSRVTDIFQQKHNPLMAQPIVPEK